MGTPTSRQRSVALVLLCLFGGCLNPRPEELPSNAQLEPEVPSDARQGAPGANAESAPTAAAAPEEDSNAAPEATSLAAPPADAGANAGVELDAGVSDDSAPDGG
jgi:hypothetical protein